MVFLTAGIVALIDWYRGRDSLAVFRGWPKLLIDYVCGLVFFLIFAAIVGMLILFVKVIVCMIQGFRFNGDKNKYYTYDTYYYIIHPYRLDWIFLWYVWSMWNVNPTLPASKDTFCCCVNPKFCPYGATDIPCCNLGFNLLSSNNENNRAIGILGNTSGQDMLGGCFLLLLMVVIVALLTFLIGVLIGIFSYLTFSSFIYEENIHS